MSHNWHTDTIVYPHGNTIHVPWIYHDVQWCDHCGAERVTHEHWPEYDATEWQIAVPLDNVRDSR